MLPYVNVMSDMKFHLLMAMLGRTSWAPLPRNSNKVRASGKKKEEKRVASCLLLAAQQINDCFSRWDDSPFLNFEPGQGKWLKKQRARIHWQASSAAKK